MFFSHPTDPFLSISRAHGFSWTSEGSSGVAVDTGLSPNLWWAVVGCGGLVKSRLMSMSRLEARPDCW